jgi:hypothetical protein
MLNHVFGAGTFELGEVGLADLISAMVLFVGIKMGAKFKVKVSVYTIRQTTPD